MDNDLTYKIIGACIEVHRTLGGPGLLESIYSESLFHELNMMGLKVLRNQPVPVIYKNLSIKSPLVLDMIVEDRVIVEAKATENHNKIFESQLLTYLRLTGKKIGLLINFGSENIKDGIHRIIN